MKKFKKFVGSRFLENRLTNYPTDSLTDYALTITSPNLQGPARWESESNQNGLLEQRSYSQLHNMKSTFFISQHDLHAMSDKI